MLRPHCKRHPNPPCHWTSAEFHPLQICVPFHIELTHNALCRLTKGLTHALLADIFLLNRYPFSLPFRPVERMAEVRVNILRRMERSLSGVLRLVFHHVVVLRPVRMIGFETIDL